VQVRDEQLLRDRLMLLAAKACEIVQQSFKNAGRQLFKIGDRLPTEAFSLPFCTLWFRSETLSPELRRSQQNHRELTAGACPLRDIRVILRVRQCIPFHPL